MPIRRPGPFPALCVGVVALGCGAGIAGATTAPDPSPPDATTSDEARSLRILLTNDDGWAAAGIQAIRYALVAEGHDVVVVAPAENQSGSGARIRYSEGLTLAQPAPGVFSVTGSPADAAEVGMSIAFDGELPDLVVSGTNIGQNTASAAVHSGTVGAAVTAINEAVPAIAVSTELGEDDFGPTAAFTAELVAALATAAGDGPVLPDDIGLNVNFPRLDQGESPAGVAVTTTDRAFLEVSYLDVAVPPVGESVEIAPALSLLDGVDPAGDAARLAAGFVTVTFITGDYDVAPPAGLEAIGPLTDVITALAVE